MMASFSSKSSRLSILLTVAVLLALFLALHGPIHQDPAYHDFADSRTLLGIPHCCNVASNIPFLLVGILGVIALAKGSSPGVLPALRPAYYHFFIGTALVAFGSAYYHWAPDNVTLLWDRLPMTIAFMAFFAIVIGENIGRESEGRLGARFLWPLTAFGLISAIYWGYSESRGTGDLRLYVFTQFLPIFLIPLILLLFPSYHGRSYYFWGGLGSYLISKVLEHYDRSVFQLLGEGISGHTLKHLVAAVATGWVLLAVIQRKPPEREALHEREKMRER